MKRIHIRHQPALCFSLVAQNWMVNRAACIIVVEWVRDVWYSCEVGVFTYNLIISRRCSGWLNCRTPLISYIFIRLAIWRLVPIKSFIIQLRYWKCFIRVCFCLYLLTSSMCCTRCSQVFIWLLSDLLILLWCHLDDHAWAQTCLAIRLYQIVLHIYLWALAFKCHFGFIVEEHICHLLLFYSVYITALTWNMLHVYFVNKMAMKLNAQLNYKFENKKI